MESNGNGRPTLNNANQNTSMGGALLGGSSTTTTFPANLHVSGNLSGGTLNTNWNGYGYQYWPTYYDYTVPNRVAQLEGEVKVLREMVAALLSGHAPKASAKR